MSRPEKSLYVHPSIFVMPCEYGFGVFTEAFIPSGTVIEECHWIKYRRDDVSSPIINDYVYEVAEEPADNGKKISYNALVLGFGSIYNHSFDNNAQYLYDEAKNVFVYQSVRDIEPGEQIFISYGNKWWDTRKGTEQPDH